MAGNMPSFPEFYPRRENGKRRKTKLETSGKRSGVFSVKLETTEKRDMETKRAFLGVFVSFVSEP
jgi:hypothetical protein